MRKLLCGMVALAVSASVLVTPVFAKEYWIESEGFSRSKIDVNGKEATFFTDHTFRAGDGLENAPPTWVKEYKITGFNSAEVDERGIITFYVDKGATFEGEQYGGDNTLFVLFDGVSGTENVVQTKVSPLSRHKIKK